MPIKRIPRTLGHEWRANGTLNDYMAFRRYLRGNRLAGEGKQFYLESPALWEDFIGDGLPPDWLLTAIVGPDIGADANGVSIDEIGGVFRVFATGSGSSAYLDLNGFRPADRTVDPVFQVRCRLNATIQQTIVFGLAGLSNLGNDLIVFINDPVASATNWFARTRSAAGTPTDLNLGIAVDSSFHTYMARVNDARSEVIFYTDDAQGNLISRGAIRTTIPSARLQPFLYASAKELVEKRLDSDYFGLWIQRT